MHMPIALLWRSSLVSTTVQVQEAARVPELRLCFKVHSLSGACYVPHTGIYQTVIWVIRSQLKHCILPVVILRLGQEDLRLLKQAFLMNFEMEEGVTLEHVKKTLIQRETKDITQRIMT